MSAITDEEMAAVLDPALVNPVADDEEEEEAVRSQLMANIEQNTLELAANTASEASIKDSGILIGHYEDISMEDAVNGTEVPPDETGTTKTNVSALDLAMSGVSEEELDSEDDLPRVHNSAEVQRTSVGATQERAEEMVASAAVGEQEDEDFKSASSKLIGNEVADAGSPKSGSEAEQGSDKDRESDDEIDTCLFCDLKDPEQALAKGALSCMICRRPAHIVCARSHEILTEDLQSWRCPSCSQNRASASPKEIATKARHSAPRLVRDLLPVSRGVQKPGAHSIFAQTLIPDDEGGRALRKRKSPSVEHAPRRDKQKKRMIEAQKPEKVEPEVVSHSTRRSSQKLALGMAPVPTARVLQHRPFHKPPPHKFILAFRLDQSKIEAILSLPPRPSRKKYSDKKKQKIPAPTPYQPPVPKFPALPTHNLIFPSMFGDRESETNAKPYGGILSETEAETSRSLPQMRDREIFEIARKEAEEERKKTSAKAEAEMNGLNGEGGNVASSKRTVSGPPSKIKCIQFGKYVIDTSYAAPYPEEYSHESRLFICEFCLKYLPSEFVAWRHKLKCPAKHPPGDEIYRDGSLSIWEVDGRKRTEYCQCLCLMAKLFLGSKTLYYDVDPFLFYVLTEYDELGYHFVGYFSKEKRPASQNNVSCILVMPIHQRKGYATFLIEFSYLLTRIEGKEGSPEKPLSDMGLTAYRSYWDLTISKHLLDIGDNPFSVKDMMERTGMTADDVVHSLERLYAFVKDPVTKAYAIRYDKVLYKGIVEKYESKDFRHIKPERLIWTPYIMGRSDAATLDAQPITAVAQRDEGVTGVKEEVGSDQISPKVSKEPSQGSPTTTQVDPALVDKRGSIAPGPPPVVAMNGNVSVVMDAEFHESILPNGTPDKGKATVEDSLSGYALTYRVEKIPPSRYQIDPPIPAAMLRKSSIRRKSTAGTPKTNGVVNGKPVTPQPVRSSPRKAGSVNGSTTGRGSSRGTSPDKASVSVRRSGRRSGLVNEIVTADPSGEEDEDEDAIMEDDDEDGDGKSIIGRELAEENSDGGSVSEDDRSEQSEESSIEEEEESSASDDPDADVDEDDDEDSNDEEEEEDVDVDVEVEVPSAITSSVTSGSDEASESGEED